jgi:transcriptional regulator with GAF, ATPase, and Fis domain
MVRLVAPRDTTVLITGESGTGKDLGARAVHHLSPRRHKPLVIINCAAIPEALLEAELFGFVKGPFTGAVQSRIGRIHAAQGGTLFLDEIGELPPCNPNCSAF